MEIFTLTRQDLLASNCHIIISGDYFSVVDPSVSYFTACSTVTGLPALTPRFIILTHGHIDHFWEIDSYISLGMKVLVSSQDGEKLSDPHLNCGAFIHGPITEFCGESTPISEGQSIDLGADTLSVLHTPGHTSGSVSLVGKGALISGDTIFAGGGYGRYDLPSGNSSELILSIKRLVMLPDDLTVYSGHGENGRLGTLKKYFRFI